MTVAGKRQDEYAEFKIGSSADFIEAAEYHELFPGVGLSVLPGADGPRSTQASQAVPSGMNFAGTITVCRWWTSESFVSKLGPKSGSFPKTLVTINAGCSWHSPCLL